MRQPELRAKRSTRIPALDYLERELGDGEFFAASASLSPFAIAHVHVNCDRQALSPARNPGHACEPSLTACTPIFVQHPR